MFQFTYYDQQSSVSILVMLTSDFFKDVPCVSNIIKLLRCVQTVEYRQTYEYKQIFMGAILFTSLSLEKASEYFDVLVLHEPCL
jgi:hypothetical protein